MIITSLILFSLGFFEDNSKTKPVGMILDLSGKVELRPTGGPPKLASLGDLLYAGERIAVSDGATATVAILRGAVQETLKTGVEVTVGIVGCSPPEAVAKRSIQRRAVATTMEGLVPEQNNSRKAGVMLRGDLKSQITPILDATVASDRPVFRWKATEGAKSYRIKLFAVPSPRLLWSAESKGPNIEFPEDLDSLQRGGHYRWEVTDQVAVPVAHGAFKVADESELDQIEGLKELEKSESRADRIATALAYQRLKAYSEAITMFERLAKDSPREPLFRQALAELHEQAGHAKRSRTPLEER